MRRNVRIRSVSGCSNFMRPCSGDAAGSSAAVFMALFCASAARSANSDCVVAAWPRRARDSADAAAPPAARVLRACRCCRSRRGPLQSRQRDPPARATSRALLRVASRRAHEALELHVLGAIDDQHAIHELAEVGFDEQRHGDDGVRPRALQRASRASARGSAGAGGPRAARRLAASCEDELAQRGAVQLAGSVQHLGPNAARTAARPGSPGATTSRAIRSVSMSAAPSATNRRRPRFAARDAAGQPTTSGATGYMIRHRLHSPRWARRPRSRPLNTGRSHAQRAKSDSYMCTSRSPHSRAIHPAAAR